MGAGARISFRLNGNLQEFELPAEGLQAMLCVQEALTQLVAAWAFPDTASGKTAANRAQMARQLAESGARSCGVALGSRAEQHYHRQQQHHQQHHQQQQQPGSLKQLLPSSWVMLANKHETWS
jgi:hypothetical protein